MRGRAMDVIREIEDEIHDADSAYLSAMQPKEINGIQLEPFSLMRQAISIEICGLDAQSAFFEAIVRTWLCTLKPADCIKALRNKDKSVEEAFGWAAAQGISLQNAKVLMALYARINAEIAHSTNV